jgi:biotin carboxyl carrier protein
MTHKSSAIKRGRHRSDNDITLKRKEVRFMANVDGTPLTSPMPGKIVDYHKSDGSRVMAGETIITIESRPTSAG